MPAAFCISSKGGDLRTCLDDNSKQTEICNQEWLNRGKNSKEPGPGVQSANAIRAEIAKKVGSCVYKTDFGITKVSEVKNAACGTKKFICSFEAKCTAAPSVIGQCFADSGKCPADPIDCIAIRDIVGIRTGTDAIDPNLRLNPDPKTPGVAR